jgi:chaperonin cofactor prefoldin
MDDKDRIIAELREQIEELETRVSTLDIAVNHWQHNYKQLDLLYSQLAGRS